jgi:hypothetical protein
MAASMPRGCGCAQVHRHHGNAGRPATTQSRELA